MNAVKTLAALDFGGTLDGAGIPPRDRRWHLYSESGYAFDRELLRAAHIYTRDRIMQLDGRATWTIETSVAAWFSIEGEYLGIPRQLSATMASEFVEDESTRLRRAETVLRSASDHMSLAVITNNIGNVPFILARAGLANYFTAIVDSSLCGYRKPDPEIFRYCQREATVENANCCWYLGDNWEKDVVGSRSAGWHAVLFRPEQPTVEEKPVKSESDWDVPVVTSLTEYFDRVGHAIGRTT
jgi:putative hydrolase of the HAD superfamily